MALGESWETRLLIDTLHIRLDDDDNRAERSMRNG